MWKKDIHPVPRISIKSEWTVELDIKKKGQTFLNPFLKKERENENAS